MHKFVSPDARVHLLVFQKIRKTSNSNNIKIVFSVFSNIYIYIEIFV